MLGMMNAASDSVEFYSTNQNRTDEVNLNESDKKAFTEVKTKPVVTYTKGTSTYTFILISQSINYTITYTKGKTHCCTIPKETTEYNEPFKPPTNMYEKLKRGTFPSEQV